MNIYAELDAAITKAVKQGQSYFHALFYGDVKECACKVATQLVRRTPMQVVDGRLQALRRQGALLYTRGVGWHVAPKELS